MKIYHTETQVDYDALMVELEAEGCTWGNREIPIKGIRWENSIYRTTSIREEFYDRDSWFGTPWKIEYTFRYSARLAKER